jgi:hypothetical protein
VPQKLSSVTRPVNEGVRRGGLDSDTSGRFPTVLPTAGCDGMEPPQPAQKGSKQGSNKKGSQKGSEQGSQATSRAGVILILAAERRLRRGVIGVASLESVFLSGTMYRRKVQVERAEGAGREQQLYEVELKFSVPDMRAIEQRLAAMASDPRVVDEHLAPAQQL